MSGLALAGQPPPPGASTGLSGSRASLSSLPTELKAVIVACVVAQDAYLENLLSGAGGETARLAVPESGIVNGLRAVSQLSREFNTLAATHTFKELSLLRASSAFFRRRILPSHGAKVRQVSIDFYEGNSQSAMQKALATLPSLPNVHDLEVNGVAAAFAFGDIRLFASTSIPGYNTDEDDSTADVSDVEDNMHPSHVRCRVVATAVANRAFLRSIGPQITTLSAHDFASHGLVALLSLFSQLTTLHISGNCLYQSAEAGAALAGLSKLEYLSINDFAPGPIHPAWLGPWKSPLKHLHLWGTAVVPLVESFASTLEKLSLWFPEPNVSYTFSHSNFPLLKDLSLKGHFIAKIPSLLNSLASSVQAPRAPLQRLDISLPHTETQHSSATARPEPALILALKRFEETLRDVRITSALDCEVLGLHIDPLVLAHTTVTTGSPLNPFFRRPPPAQARAEPDGGRAIAEGYHTALVEALDFGRGVVDRALAEGDLEELGKMLETLQRIKGLQMLQ
ncbi:hypothetical protein RQP46_007566 [Phenoliferia psychrophenolica]